MIAYGCCVGSWDKFERWVKRSDSQLLYALGGQGSIAVAYNEILNTVKMRSGVRALVLQHDDLQITDPDFEYKVLGAFVPDDVALVGVAGGQGITSLAWWNANTYGHQMLDSGLLDFGLRTGDVDLLEGSLLIFSRWAIDHLRFDLRFSGFHGYDDIAMTATREWGRRAVVADISTHHHTSLGFKTEQNEKAWLAANELFRQKWGL
ncbi:MAG: glycosyltransferase [Nitrososphaera sp.]